MKTPFFASFILTLFILAGCENLPSTAHPLLISHPLDNNFLVENPEFWKELGADPALFIPPLELLIPVEKAEGAKRGFILGDSFLSGYPFSINQAAPLLASVGLNQTAGKTLVELYNLARVGVTSKVLLTMAAELAGLSPDFIVISLGNDEFSGLKFSQDALSSVENVKKIVGFFESKGIRVLLVIPEANLVGMSPLQAPSEPEVRTYLETLSQKIHRDGTKALSSESARISQFLGQYPGDLNLLWLQAILPGLEGQALDVDLLEDIRDRDPSTVRGKTAFFETLRKTYPQALDVSREFAKRSESFWSGPAYYLDHAHLNKAGQALLALLIARELNDKLDLKISNPALAAYFGTPDKVLAGGNFTFLSEAAGVFKLDLQGRSSLYSQQALALPKANLGEWTLGKIWSEASLSEALEKRDFGLLEQEYLKALADVGNSPAVLQEALSALFRRPADPEAYLKWVMLSDSLTTSEESLLNLWKRGWGLSGKSEEYRTAYRDFLESVGRKELAEKVGKE